MHLVPSGEIYPRIRNIIGGENEYLRIAFAHLQTLNTFSNDSRSTLICGSDML